MVPHILIVLLCACTSVSSSESLFLFQQIQNYSTQSLLSDSLYLTLSLCSWYIEIRLLCRKVSMDMFVFSYIQLSTLTSTIFENADFFPMCIPGFFDKTHVSLWELMPVSLIQFYLSVCLFYANALLFLLL